MKSKSSAVCKPFSSLEKLSQERRVREKRRGKKESKKEIELNKHIVKGSFWKQGERMEQKNSELKFFEQSTIFHDNLQRKA